MNHKRDLAEAFDGQAAQFELAPVQCDPAAIGRLIRDADFPDSAYVLDFDEWSIGGLPPTRRKMSVDAFCPARRREALMPLYYRVEKYGSLASARFYGA